jgi:hypothetical protein
MSGIIEEDNIQPPPHYREGGSPQVITADTARQGPKGARVLVVLVASLIGALTLFGIMSAIWSHS